MSTFSKRLKQLRLEHDLTQQEVADYLRTKLEDKKTTKGLISRYETGKNEPKNFHTTQYLAELFRVHVNYLTGDSDSKDGAEEATCRIVPLLGSISAGQPVLLQEENIIGSECVLSEDKVDFCLTVKGDSMINADIQDGDIVFVKQQPEVENGEIAVVMINDEEATLKRFYRINGSVILRPENPNHKETIIKKRDGQTVKILGKVLFNKSRVK